MSLINQMLRDLEQRRRTGKRRLPSRDRKALSRAAKVSRRLLFFTLGGLALAAVFYFSSDEVDRLFLFGSKPPERVVATPPTLPLAKEAAGTEDAAVLPAPNVVAQPEVAQPEVAQPALIAPPLPAESRPVAVTRKPVKSAVEVSKPFAGIVSLLNLGVLETVASTRLLLEFEQLPEYRWQVLDESGRRVQIRLSATLAQPGLPVAQVQGPLLKTLRLQQQKNDLLLLLESSQPIKLNALELPADSLHGQRLLLELYRQTPLPVVLPEKVAAEPVEEKTEQEQELAKATPEAALQAYNDALTLLERDNYSAAEALFSHALELQPTMLKARLQLISLLYRQERGDAAAQLLGEGLALHPEDADLRKGYARSLMAEGQFSAAIGVLQSKPRPELGDDLDYYALLAALQQKDGNFQDAAKNYQALLEYRPERALWWLGLAISLEQAGDGAGAKEAYRQAASLPGLQPDLQKYVKGRLQEL